MAPPGAPLGLEALPAQRAPEWAVGGGGARPSRAALRRGGGRGGRRGGGGGGGVRGGSSDSARVAGLDCWKRTWWVSDPPDVTSGGWPPVLG